LIDSLLELGCRPVFSLYENRWVVATKLIELFVILEPTLGPTTLTTGMRSGLLYSDTVNVVSVVGCFPRAFAHLLLPRTAERRNISSTPLTP